MTKATKETDDRPATYELDAPPHPFLGDPSNNPSCDRCGHGVANAKFHPTPEPPADERYDDCNHAVGWCRSSEGAACTEPPAAQGKGKLRGMQGVSYKRGAKWALEELKRVHGLLDTARARVRAQAEEIERLEYVNAPMLKVVQRLIDMRGELLAAKSRVENLKTHVADLQEQVSRNVEEE